MLEKDAIRSNHKLAAMFSINVALAMLFHETGAPLSVCGLTTRAVTILFENLRVFLELTGGGIHLSHAFCERLDLMQLLPQTWTILQPCLRVLVG